MHISTTLYGGFLLYCLLLMFDMRNFVPTNNPQLLEAIFWVCTAIIAGSGAWILFHIW